MALLLKSRLSAYISQVSGRHPHLAPLLGGGYEALKVQVPPKGSPSPLPIISLQLRDVDNLSETNLDELLHLVKSDPPENVADVELNDFVIFRKWESKQKQKSLDFRIDAAHFYRQVFPNVSNPDRYRQLHIKTASIQPKKVIVEFSSPNIAKPFHVGHFRSTIIGNVFANLFSYFDHQVTRINYLGDWGTQFGLLSHGFNTFGSEEKLGADPLAHLLEVYVKANSLAETDETFREAAKAIFSGMESGQDTKALEQWRRFRSLSIEELEKMYNLLNIRFDHYESESMYAQSANALVRSMIEKGIGHTAEDSAKLIKIGTKEVALTKNDGSTLYISRDLAAATERREKYHFDEMFYVVGNDQQQHFRHLKLILKEMGHEWADNLTHIRYGQILGLSTRRGQVVFLSDILQEAFLRSKQDMNKTTTTKSTSADEVERVAFTLGVSALMVQDLRFRRTKDYNFSWSESLRQDGDTGVSIQLAYARLCNLEANSTHLKDMDLDECLEHLMKSPEATRLLLHLAQFDQVLDDCLQEQEPSLLVLYLFRLSRQIGSAYKVLFVTTETNEDLGRARLQLFRSAKGILERGMRIVGLSPLTSI